MTVIFSLFSRRVKEVMRHVGKTSAIHLSARDLTEVDGVTVDRHGQGRAGHFVSFGDCTKGKATCCSSLIRAVADSAIGLIFDADSA